VVLRVEKCRGVKAMAAVAAVDATG
jgi:hypothetical protein